MKSVLDYIKSLISDNNNNNYQFILPNKENYSYTTQPEDLLKNKKVFSNLDVNLEYVNSRFNSLLNSDIKIREFVINVKSKQFKAFILYVDGMVDKDSINDSVLKPLMLRNRANQYDGNQIISEAVANNIMVRKIKKFSIVDYIFDNLLPQNDVEKVNSFDKISEDVVSGNCILFVDTVNFVFDIDTKKFDKRSIAEAKNEPVIMGSQEAFVENLRTNTSMIRRNLCNENLVIEKLTVGKTDKNQCAVCYLKNIANSDLVAEVKYRLNNLDVEYINSIGELQQLIKDDIGTTVPETISTERVDKATAHILEGRVVVIFNGVPYVLIMPVTMLDFLSSPEDTNINPVFANLLKVIRAISFFITLLLPGLYIAITTYHGELIPTGLLFSIIASRAKVPFMVIVEIILMEVSFEIIREAGVRVPSPLGSTVGIVGALILGQAAVQADIVSPILIINIAITAITSFAIPDYNFSFHLRINRFLFIVLGFLAGFFGIAIGLFIYLVKLCSLKSFGVSYLAPYSPFTKNKSTSYLLEPIWKREKRADFLATQKSQIQNHISMKWRKKGD
ncbi:MAG: spore germination protein [Clostridia bacterium]|nr:spore germination protein [Clostridia bacterium]